MTGFGVADTRTAVERFDAAFSRGDVDRIMAAMTDDCVFDDTTTPEGMRHQGQSEVRRCWDELFAGSPGAVLDGGHVRGVDVSWVGDGKVAERYS